MFAGWQTFFQTAAEAAATLTGLVFVVITLAAGRQTTALNTGGRLFTSPTVYHLTSVLIVSALALAPVGSSLIASQVVTAAMTLWALGSFVYAAVLLSEILGLKNATHWSDLWCYGVAPTLAYAWLTAAAGSAVLQLTYAPHAVAIGMLALLLISIRNAWDLATWLAPRREPPPQG